MSQLLPFRPLIREGIQLLKNTSWPVRILALVLVLLVISAHLLVQVTHEARSQQVRLQTLEGERDALQVEWGRLLLEESVLVTPVRLEQLASEHFQLRLPETSDLDIRVIQ
ncbi:cell division protein FtsL [Marinospirillum celere]|uniref:Cell division protein FtsL n=1 Tax=Marinospirillum celere TaxID=1122252 RepID=A0A1I1FYT6_9GAMM|nr:cell division protein FtsL [Marinospirillum celere]SFC04455.1 cell division protein FtsL [Marinospirillum celere]